jgi:adenosylcobinamide-GDP ribazoletransferase
MHFEFNTDDYARGIFYFPLIGGIIGLLLWPIIFVQGFIPTRVFPFIIIILYLLIVGGIHIDGIGDLFDGIFSARDQKRMLEIMSDSHIGAFGVVGIILYFMGMYVGLYEVMHNELFSIILISMPLIGRSVALIGAGLSRYAKAEGLGKAVIDRVGPLTSLILSLLLVGGYFVVFPMLSLSIIITLVVMLSILWRIHRTLDGITGDVLGALVEISQIVFLLVAGMVIV